MIKFTIDGRKVEAQKGETILNVARREGIYIPTMCYLEKTTPGASCRMCIVEADGTDGFLLSCQTPPVEGVAVTTNSQELETERKNIMRMYDVNHPLECGVCDKSGACDLQNKTLEFGIDRQHFSAKDQRRDIKHWGLINYDPSLCILCEKCVHVCNEIIGDDAIEVQFGGYNSTIIPKNSDELDCTFCGECIAVCPVGALVSSEFQYSANAWELSRVPATCSHCSSGCALEYEVKTGGATTVGKESIYRVTNNFEYATLCGAGRFNFDFAVDADRDDTQFTKAVDALQNCEAISFSSIITNEEALILQTLKEKLGIKLFNEDARHFQEFMHAYSAKSNKLHYSATLQDVKDSDAVIMFGSRIGTDNPGVRYAITETARHNGAKTVYMHPLEDTLLQNTMTQFVKYEVGTEEGVIALLARELLKDVKLNKEDSESLALFDEGYLSAESNVGEEEIEAMMKSFHRASKKTLIVGSDILSHEKSLNIAALVGLIDRYSEFDVMVVPKYVNTLGASLICELDPIADIKTVGYNAQGSYVIASFGNRDLSVAALNQQEGTVVSIDKKVLPTNVALSFKGYTLNDLAFALGICDEDGDAIEHTINYTCNLPQEKGFEAIDFDALENFYSPLGDDVRGYELKNVRVNRKKKIQDVEELPEFNGVVVYHCEPVLQFNSYTSSRASEDDTALIGSAQFSVAAKISDGDLVAVELANQTVQRRFKLDNTLKGTVALNPTFDLPLGALDGQYRFEKVKIMKVGS
ncbi:MAG: NADH-quinone oxidoreductase subunit G [Campylobacterota bacterium]|nr:NADH-quinone oxidoreductase subunit G [Campylobacterota bacterium]